MSFNLEANSSPFVADWLEQCIQVDSEIQQEGVLSLMSTIGSDLLRIRNKNQAYIRAALVHISHALVLLSLNHLGLRKVAYNMCVHTKLLQLCAVVVTLWRVAHWASLSMGFSQQEYWSGLPCPPPSSHPLPLPTPPLPISETEPTSLMPPAFAGGSLPLSHRGSPDIHYGYSVNRYSRV